MSFLLFWIREEQRSFKRGLKIALFDFPMVCRNMSESIFHNCCRPITLIGLARNTAENVNVILLLLGCSVSAVERSSEPVHIV